jgi:hypothetical protein
VRVSTITAVYQLVNESLVLADRAVIAILFIPVTDSVVQSVDLELLIVLGTQIK